MIQLFQSFLQGRVQNHRFPENLWKTRPYPFFWQCIGRHIETWPEIASQYGFDNALRKYHPRYDHNYHWNYLIEQTINLDREKVRWVNHVDAHAATAYFASPFDEAAVLVTEGGTGIYKGSNTDLVPVDRIGYLGDTYQDGLKLTKRMDL